VLTTLTVGFGAWQGVGTSLLLDASGRQVAGAVMATAGLGGLAGATISQYLELTHGEVWTLFSGSVWGATLGVIAANIGRTESGGGLTAGQHVGITTLASDVGLGLSALALSPVLGWSARRVGFVNLFGLGGIALGSAIGGPIQSEMGTQIGAISGTVAGLTAGVILTGIFGWGEDRPGTTAGEIPVDPSGALTASGAAASTSASKRYRIRTAGAGPESRIPPVVADWTPAVMMEPDTDPKTGEAGQGSVKMLFGVRGLLH
jgi:hypothetical protein